MTALVATVNAATDQFEYFSLPASFTATTSSDEAASLMENGQSAGVYTLENVVQKDDGSWTWTCSFHELDVVSFGSTFTISFDPIRFDGTSADDPATLDMSGYAASVTTALQSYGLVYDGSSSIDYVDLGKFTPTSDGTADPALDYADAVQAVIDGHAGMVVSPDNGSNTVVMPAGRNFYFGGTLDDTVPGAVGNVLHGGSGAGDRLTLRLGTQTAPMSFVLADVLTHQVSLGGVVFDGFEQFSIATGSGDDILDLRNAAMPLTSDFALGGGSNTVYVNATSFGAITAKLTGNDHLVADFTGLTVPVTLTAAGITIPSHAIPGSSATTAGFSFTATASTHFSDIAVTGGSGNDTIAGSAGNDTLGGGAGADSFVLGAGGADVITDFTPADGDRLDLTGLPGIRSIAQLQSLMTSTGGDTRIDLGSGQSVTLQGVDKTALGSGQFVLDTHQAVVTGHDGDVAYGAAQDLLAYDASATGQAIDLAVATEGTALTAIGGMQATGFGLFDITGSGAGTRLDLSDATLATRTADAGSSLTVSHVTLGSGANSVTLNAATQGAIALDLAGGADRLVADLSGATSAVTVTAASVVTAAFTLTADGGTQFDQMVATGGSGDDTISGTSGSDVLTGGAGADTFVFGASDGVDTITDFNASQGDVLDFSGVPFMVDYETFVHRLTLMGPDTLVDLGDGNSVLLKNTRPSNIGTENLIFASDPVCFYPGTLIRTPGGQVAVEALAPGDLVSCLDGPARPVRWIGRQTVSTRCLHPDRVRPIRIRAGALADGVPSRDLLVSPEHALFLDGNLVAAAALVNGTSITRECDVPPVFTYWHIELDVHAVIFAEDAPAESFIDNVDRLHFDNWAGHVDSIAMAELPCPRAKSQRQVPAATRWRLTARAAMIAKHASMPGVSLMTAA
jgi:Ca2+-binding RTX toxin-like protein